jgi:AcrR family transcriptional regulator
MSPAAGDLRVRRTHKLIREAFIALLEERGFDAITVGELASRAMVSRTAFYRYYADKYDLVMKLFEETVIALNRELNGVRWELLSATEPQTRPESWAQLFQHVEEALPIPPPYVRLFEHVAQYERLYRALLSERGSSWFVRKLRAYLADVTGERLRDFVTELNGTPAAPARLLADGFVPAQLAAHLLDTMTWWLEQGRPYTPRQIATYHYRMMCSILKDIPTWE